jgi:heme exporter protein A
LLQADTLAAFRAERLVFSDVGFSLAPGAALVLAGPNGSGKSTLLRLLAGLLRPAAGSLRWNGADALADLGAHAGRVAYLGHQDAIKPALSVRSNLRLVGAPADIALALESVGLAALAELPARLLSAGQRRRLALARLCVLDRTLWLLDEPSLGLDDASVARLGVLAARHRAGGGMVIAATHLPLPLPDAAVLRLG